MRIFGVFAMVIALIAVGFAVYVRVAPSDPARWHVDPLTVADPFQPHFARVDRVVAQPPQIVAQSIARIAETEGAILLAGDAQDGTWVARTPIMGYPDYVSIRLIPEGEGTRIVAFSRSRFGYSDRGVNRARLGRWLPE